MLHRVLPQNMISHNCAYSDFGTLISQEYLEEVLKLIQYIKFKVITINELTHLINDNKDTSNCITLTFDDGYSDNFDYALPVLEKYNMKATFFPVIKPCIENSVLPLDLYYQCVDEIKLSEKDRGEYINGKMKKEFYWTEPILQKNKLKMIFSRLPQNVRVSYMNSEQIKELSDKGHEIGSHSISHSLFIADYMNNQKIRDELKQSKDILETITQKSVNSFCFPAGRYNSKNIELAKKIGYTSTCLVYKNNNEEEVIPSYERIFVKPNSIEELKSTLIEK
jgi:peptidoglycan/xylan/chitin deacetylase (PgdA/CDA1 family)